MRYQPLSKRIYPLSLPPPSSSPLSPLSFLSPLPLPLSPPHLPSSTLPLPLPRTMPNCSLPPHQTHSYNSLHSFLAISQRTPSTSPPHPPPSPLYSSPLSPPSPPPTIPFGSAGSHENHPPISWKRGDTLLIADSNWTVEGYFEALGTIKDRVGMIGSYTTSFRLTTHISCPRRRRRCFEIRLFIF